MFLMLSLTVMAAGRRSWTAATQIGHRARQPARDGPGLNRRACPCKDAGLRM